MPYPAAGPVGFLLEALAALSLGGAAGTAQAKARQSAQQQQLWQTTLQHLIQSGMPVPNDLMKLAGMDPKSAQVANFLSNAVRQRQEQIRELGLKQMQDEPAGGPALPPAMTSPGAAPTPAPPQATPPAAPVPPGQELPLGLGVPVLQPGQRTPESEGASEGPQGVLGHTIGQFPNVPQEVPPATQTQAVPPVGPQAQLAPPPPRTTIRPTPGRSFKDPLTGVTFTKPGVSQADVERLGNEQERLQNERQRLADEQARTQMQREEHAQKRIDVQRKQDGEVLVRSLLEQAAAAPDAKSKLPLFERAYAVAAGTGLSSAGTIGTELGRLQAGAGPLNLKDPNTAEWVAENGTHPVTGEPVTPVQQKQAKAFVGAQKERKLEQATAVAQSLADIQTKQAPIRMAVAGGIKTLIKEGDNVNKTKNVADRINGALKTIEDNLDVFPATVVGRPLAYGAEFFQTERGRRMLQVKQALTVLQSLEPRQLAGEQGRIANQIEQQWRAVQPDPTKVTRKTAQALIASAKDRVRDLARANIGVVQRNAKAARSAGVPESMVKAFTEGDIDVLTSVMGEGLQTGTLPPILDMGDLDLSGAQQVR